MTVSIRDARESKLLAPPVTDEELAKRERELTADGYRKQLMTNYALSLPSSAIEPFVQLREEIKQSGEYPRWLKSFVASYQMIYSQPVAHEIPLIDRPTLFIMGANDHNAPGRPFAPPELRAKMGQNAALAQAVAARMANAKVKVFEGVGHLGHLEATQPFNEALLNFSANSAFRQRASGPANINRMEGAHDACLDRICGQRTRARQIAPGFRSKQLMRRAQRQADKASSGKRRSRASIYSGPVVKLQPTNPFVARHPSGI